jgi:hypothetical protein
MRAREPLRQPANPGSIQAASCQGQVNAYDKCLTVSFDHGSCGTRVGRQIGWFDPLRIFAITPTTPLIPKEQIHHG